MMGEGLGLKGCDLLLYANIMSYSKQGKEMYESTVKLAHRFGYSREHVAKTLDYLVGQGLIIRSEHRHPGNHAYCYSINWGKVEKFGMTLNKDVTQADENKGDMGTNITCEQMSHVKKSDIHMRTKFTSACELSSHDNNIIYNNTDKRRRDNVLSPFSFILLNNKWQILINQPKWKEKTNDALQVSIDELKKHGPCEAMLMMDYSISGNYPGIYDPALL